ncbi:RING/FYVE/PHD zinc finger superfamily protein [Tasmannia lanceolata]|uniref:RING/FYVE/PHD zinc finger superfamily protein n=1 Tax=Tasmannia lanceolata TaxID=3420 RepID=UPI00406435CD
MEGQFHGLPPLKRFKLLHQNTEKSQSHLKAHCLPAKKRIEPRNLPTTTTYCLPAKKRIWAPPPLPNSFDPEEETPKKNSKFDITPNESKIIDEATGQNAQEFSIEVSDEDGIICNICHSTDGDPLDPIVFCDGCDLTVHASCYGNPLIRAVPEGDWFCSRCIFLQNRGEVKQRMDFNCCLCPILGGATKPTVDGRWAHIMCALLVPEVFFKDPYGREGIDCSSVPLRRWKGICYVCNSARGCATECSEPKCSLMFHVSCGLKEDLCIEYNEGKTGGIVAGFCNIHTQLWKKQQQTGKFKIVPRESKKESGK